MLLTLRIYLSEGTGMFSADGFLLDPCCCDTSSLCAAQRHGSPATTVNKGTGNDRQLVSALQLAKEKANDDGEDAVVWRPHAQQVAEVNMPDRIPFGLMNEA